jgi:hypothetical protein
MLSDARTTSGVNAWYADDLTFLSDQRLVSPQITLPSADQSPITLHFQNYQAFEQPNGDGRCWDAGILEISTNNGGTWSKVPNSALLTDPYDNIIWNDQAGNNPITLNYGATLAWCDPGQPFINSVVLLDNWAEQTVRFRWRMGTDSAAGGEGWYIDDVRVQSCEVGSSNHYYYLPNLTSGSTPLAAQIDDETSAVPFAGLAFLPALAGVLPIWMKRRR